MMEEEDPYRLLEVLVSCSAVEVKKAFKEKARLYHPDKNPSPNAAAIFHQLERAREVLLDNKLRAELDSRLRGKLQRQKRDQERDVTTKAMRDKLHRREQEYKQQQQQQQQPPPSSSQQRRRGNVKRKREHAEEEKDVEEEVVRTTKLRGEDTKGEEERQLPYSAQRFLEKVQKHHHKESSCSTSAALETIEELVFRKLLTPIRRA